MCLCFFIFRPQKLIKVVWVSSPYSTSFKITSLMMYILSRYSKCESDNGDVSKRIRTAQYTFPAQLDWVQLIINSCEAKKVFSYLIRKICHTWIWAIVYWRTSFIQTWMWMRSRSGCKHYNHKSNFITNLVFFFNT